jgi:uracil-DNA glycosylase
VHDRRELLELVQAMRARLDWWREGGVETIPAGAVSDTAPRDERGASRADREPPPQSRDHDVATSDHTVTDTPERAATLADLRAVIGDCQRCKLAPHRTNLVFGVGNPQADLVFVGEAPGRDEDLRGEPFVGRAGQLLTEIIVKGMKIRREDVYIANIIKCRPPQNRNPEPDEIAACEPFLIRQLALIHPKAIVALGTFAAQTLLKNRTPITRLRGTWADYHGIPLMPTFHPAYLLRNPGDKRLVWQDIQQVMTKLGLR